jgi:hypothetical protein
MTFKCFIIAYLIIVIVLLCLPIWLLYHNSYSHFIAERRPDDWLTAFFTFYLAIITVSGAIITASVILWQGQQLKKQLELQVEQGYQLKKQLEMEVLIDLFKEWNSDKMRKIRSDYFIEAITDKDLDKKEDVLEYLEKMASYYRRKMIDKELIWDTIGWYVLRYYYYNRDAIEKIRKRWRNDKTLYQDLEDLYDELFKWNYLSVQLVRKN